MQRTAGSGGQWRDFEHARGRVIMSDENMHSGGSTDAVSSNPDLSAEGLQRRDEILRTLERALVRRRRVRLAGRAAAGGGAVLVLLASILLVTGDNRRSPTAIDEPQVIVADSPQKAPAHDPVLPGALTMVRIVNDDQEIVKRLAAPAPAVRVVLIDDDELLELLSRAGMPDGLIRTRTVVMLSSEFRAALER
jgi:hypothetical protein